MEPLTMAMEPLAIGAAIGAMVVVLAGGAPSAPADEGWVKALAGRVFAIARRSAAVGLGGEWGGECGGDLLGGEWGGDLEAGA